MNANVSSIWQDKDGYEITYVNVEKQHVWSRKYAYGTRQAEAVLFFLIRTPHDERYNEGLTLHSRHIGTDKPIRKWLVNDEWLDPEEEQARDEQETERLTPDPIPDRLVTDVMVVKGAMFIDCRQDGEGRPRLHSARFDDRIADDICQLFSDHLFTFSPVRDGVKLHANELIPCPFCHPRSTE